MNKRINTLFVTMFGLGKINFMPGTFGSLATTILLYSSFHVLDFSANLILVGLIIIFIYSFYAVESYIKDNKDKDPREIIIDEFLGQSIPIFFYEISHGGGRENGNIIFIYFIFFLLFRCFDIMKPFPVNYFDKNFKNSFGVIMDDICAGLYVVLTLICFMIIKNFIL